MSGKAFFIDTTLCTGCRGCQIACKQWNQLPATKTENRGSFQNPADLSFYTYKLVRFSEDVGGDGKPVWYFSRTSAVTVLSRPARRYPRTPRQSLLISLPEQYSIRIS